MRMSRTLFSSRSGPTLVTLTTSRKFVYTAPVELHLHRRELCRIDMPSSTSWFNAQRPWRDRRRLAVQMVQLQFISLLALHQ